MRDSVRGSVRTKNSSTKKIQSRATEWITERITTHTKLAVYRPTARAFRSHEDFEKFTVTAPFFARHYCGLPSECCLCVSGSGSLGFGAESLSVTLMRPKVRAFRASRAGKRRGSRTMSTPLEAREYTIVFARRLAQCRLARSTR